MKLAFRVLITLVVTLLVTSEFNPFMLFWYAFLYAVPTLLFMMLILWPAELVLARFGLELAILIVAPFLGWQAPRVFDDMGLYRDYAAAQLSITGSLGIWCGCIWAISFIFLGVRKGNPQLRDRQGAKDAPQGEARPRPTFGAETIAIARAKLIDTVTMAIFDGLSLGARRFAKFLAVVAAIVVVLYTAYVLILPSVTLRYRLTLDVEVDGAMRSGSGVVEIFYQPLPDSVVEGLDGSHFEGQMKGYAITVDLGDRGLLFVANSRPELMNPGPLFPNATTLAGLPFATYDYRLAGKPSTLLGYARELRRKTGSVDVPPELLPMIVWFRDLDDRHSGVELDPRDLAAALGPGVRLVRAKLEMTSDPISPMPKSWPKWISEPPGSPGQEMEDSFIIHAYRGKTYPASWGTDLFKGD